MSDSSGNTNMASLADELRSRFADTARAAFDAAESELARTSAFMTDLLTAAQLMSEDDDAAEQIQQIIAFCQGDALAALDGGQPDEVLRELTQQAEGSWGHLLALLSPEERIQLDAADDWADPVADGWDQNLQQSFAVSSHSSDESFSDAGVIDLEGILASLGPHADSPSEQADCSTGVSSSVSRTATPEGQSTSTVPSADFPVQTIDDAELAAAFADDAQQCLAEMESSVLALESASSPTDSLRNFCRQLHTLKGASGTVGLSDLADYLHQLESHIEASSHDAIDADQLLECVDTVRKQLKSLSPQQHPVETTASSVGGATGADAELFVRVEASRMERLMDLLSELVTLRNRRDSYVDSLRSIHDELNHCASRTRGLNSTIQPAAQSTGSSSHSGGHGSRRHSLSRLYSRSLDEVSRDTADLSKSLLEVCNPLSEDNTAVSQLIGRFRQELMELHRLPVSGLFQRLQRSIRDAAKSEGKQVEIHFEGQGARAERAIQERLFEPLLHLVRNAVSHGVQPAAARREAGKSTTGNITLSAYSNAASLIIEVRDDGEGLNDEALEARGRSLGLLPAGKVSQKQLWNLIFQPGFSTKSSVSEVSGRGVGMDVVDSWVRRLRGKIDVESIAGQGTTFRLQIPLRSAVEHVMVFRSGGQLFALPMHAVSRTSDNTMETNSADHPSSRKAVALSQLLGCEERPSSRSCYVSLRHVGETSGASHRSSVTLAVDGIVGVEEVVVRPLPSLLRGNLLFAGVTLSGRSETVLLLDARRLNTLATQASEDSTVVTSIEQGGPARRNPADDSVKESILVVDDSVVVRKSLTRKLQARGFSVQEAHNGRSAFDLLKSRRFQAVITDIDMPLMDGVELLQEIRRHPDLQDTPVAVLSSRDELSLPESLSDHNPVAILSKPVTDETITAAIQAFTSVSQTNQTSST